MPRILYSTKDNAEGQLNSGINAASTSIVLNSGEGAEFPQPYTGDCSSTGSSTTLNDTGALANLAVGDFIRNVTDGSWAFVTVAGTNSITTTRLRGGTLNVWTSGDVWQVNEFIITIETRDAATPPAVTAREKVLIKDRSTDTLTVRTRGYDSSTAQSFLAGAYVNLHVTSNIVEHMIDCFYDAMVRANTNETDIDNIESGSSFYVAAAGSSNAYTGTLSPAITAYAAGQHYIFKANHANTGAATINFNSLGAKTIKKLNDQDLASGDIENGQIVDVVYDGTNFQLVGQLGNAPAAVTLYNQIVLASAVSSTAAGSGTTSEVNIDTYTYTIPANDLVAGVGYRFHFTLDRTGAGGTPTFRVKLGSSTMASVAMHDTNGDMTIIGSVMGTAAAGASVSVRGSIFAVDDVSGYVNSADGSASVATNGTLALQISVQFSTSAVQSATIKLGWIEKFSSTAFVPV